eukprot:1286492-Prymnesium_polylepis.1
MDVTEVRIARGDHAVRRRLLGCRPRRDALRGLVGRAVVQFSAHLSPRARDATRRVSLQTWSSRRCTWRSDLLWQK